jgi:hypothetical protein
MGPGRGGAYTYDWVENVFGLGMHSADRIHPEWQQLQLDDIPSARPGDVPGPNAMRVRVLDPERTLVTASDDRHLGLGVLPLPDERRHAAPQPQLDQDRPVARRQDRHGPHIAGLLGDGAQDAAWIKDRAENIHHEQAVSESLSASL